MCFDKGVCWCVCCPFRLVLAQQLPDVMVPVVCWVSRIY